MEIDQTTLTIGLRCLRSVAEADGQFSEREQRLIEVAAQTFEFEGALELPPIEPVEAAAALSDPQARERIIQALLVMSLIDGDADEEELKVVRSFAKAFEVDEPRIKNLKHLVAKQHKLLKFDLNRRSKMTSEAVKFAYQQQGLRGVWKTIGPFLSERFALDEKLAQKYQALGDLPEDTFGYAYHQHIRENGFSFPGEPAGFPEALMKHDCCHVVGGYDTDPVGECEVVAFVAGFMKNDPFWYLFMILVHMHLGIETFDKNPLGEMGFDVDRVAAALARGSKVNRDLYDPSVDWWEYFPKPLEEVRTQLGIA